MSQHTTICKEGEGGNILESSQVNFADVINELYKKHEIVIYTARGSLSKINYEELTLGQLNKWGVSFHKLDIGNKPVFDLLIDDRALSDKHFFDDINIINL